jgi:hypothetical protein
MPVYAEAWVEAAEIGPVYLEIEQVECSAPRSWAVTLTVRDKNGGQGIQLVGPPTELVLLLKRMEQAVTEFRREEGV